VSQLMPQITHSLPDSILDALRRAKDVLVLTGAGMSAESGIPTFRDAQTGIWSKFRPAELATPEAFEADPERVWRWYQWRREKVSAAQLHAGHFALVEMAAQFPRFRLVTQNVDGLHQQAGSEAVIELHGSIMRTVCHRSGRAIDEDWIERSEDCPPRSPHTADGLARPAVVWFGEALPRLALLNAMKAAEECDFCFSIGTTALVEPAASLPRLALETGATVVEINPNRTAISDVVSHCLRGPASEVLPLVADQIKDLRKGDGSQARL
jgi:NAD-dependent deacetylase